MYHCEASHDIVYSAFTAQVERKLKVPVLSHVFAIYYISCIPAGGPNNQVNNCHSDRDSQCLLALFGIYFSLMSLYLHPFTRMFLMIHTFFVMLLFLFQHEIYPNYLR